MNEASVCYRHSDRSTRLRCSVCNKPICPDCSYDASVGQRCPDCHKSVGTTQVSRMRDMNALTGAPFTRGLLIAIVIGYAAQLMVVGFESSLIQTQVGIENNQLWRLATTAFLHGSLFHLALNGYALWILGPPIERAVGKIPFVTLWLASVIGGGVAVHLIGGYFAVVGASGALFGLFGYFLVVGFRQRKTQAGRGLLRQFGFLLAINAAAPLFFPIISWQAHLGGLLTGIAVTSMWAAWGQRSESAKSIIAGSVALVLMALVAIL